MLLLCIQPSLCVLQRRGDGDGGLWGGAEMEVFKSPKGEQSHCCLQTEIKKENVKIKVKSDLFSRGSHDS